MERHEWESTFTDRETERRRTCGYRIFDALRIHNNQVQVELRLGDETWTSSAITKRFAAAVDGTVSGPGTPDPPQPCLYPLPCSCFCLSSVSCSREPGRNHESLDAVLPLSPFPSVSCPPSKEFALLIFYLTPLLFSSHFPSFSQPLLSLPSFLSTRRRRGTAQMRAEGHLHPTTRHPQPPDPSLHSRGTEGLRKRVSSIPRTTQGQRLLVHFRRLSHPDISLPSSPILVAIPSIQILPPSHHTRLCRCARPRCESRAIHIPDRVGCSCVAVGGRDAKEVQELDSNCAPEPSLSTSPTRAHTA